MSGDLKWMLASDLHIPYHDKRMVDLWFQVMRWFKPHIVDYLGDIDDQSCFSKFSEGTVDEVMGRIATYADDVKALYADTRALRPKSELFVALGNHDVRVFDYIDRKAQAFKDAITPESLWGLDHLGYDYIYYNDLPKKRHGNLHAHHGLSVIKDAGMSAKKDSEDFGVSIIRGHCFSADTEILTRAGWKAYTELSVGDEVYTMNLDTEAGEWQQVSEKFVYDNFDKMVSVKSRLVDALVTHGHGMLVSKNGPKGYEQVDAGSLLEISDSAKRSLPLAARDQSEGISLSDEQIRMLAWIMAEGNFDPYGKNGKYRVRLAQSDAPDGRLQRLEELFQALDFKWSPVLRYSANSLEHGVWRNYDAYRMAVTAIDYQTISGYLDLSKTPTESLMKMNGRQAQVFLEEYVWADGSKNSDAKNSYQLATKTESHKDALQALATMAGYRVTVCQGPVNKMWYITYNTRNSTTFSGASVSEVEYSGEVWCVTVPNHTLVVRRNGKVFITMNSHREGHGHRRNGLATPSTVSWYEIGHMCDLNSEGFKYTAVHNWQPGFAVALVSGDEVHVQPVHIKDDYSAYVAGRKFSA